MEEAHGTSTLGDASKEGNDTLDLYVETSLYGSTGWNLVSIWGRLWFLMFLWPYLTQPSKKVHWATPFRRTSMGVDENVRVFPADSGFRRSGAPERRNPIQT